MGDCRETIAALVAGCLEDGTVVNVGIGVPGLVPQHVPDERHITFHAEHGVVGFGSDRFGPRNSESLQFFGTTYRLRPGAFVTDHTRSFALIRSGRIDVTVLGAFEVDAAGRLANWQSVGMGSGCPGGSPELAGAAGKVIAALEHRDRSGRPRLVARTELAVAVPRSADLVVTDLGVFLPEGDGFRLVRAAPGVALAEIRAATAAEVRV